MFEKNCKHYCDEFRRDNSLIRLADLLRKFSFDEIYHTDPTALILSVAILEKKSPFSQVRNKKIAGMILHKCNVHIANMIGSKLVEDIHNRKLYLSLVKSLLNYALSIKDDVYVIDLIVILHKYDLEGLHEVLDETAINNKYGIINIVRSAKKYIDRSIYKMDKSEKIMVTASGYKGYLDHDEDSLTLRRNKSGSIFDEGTVLASVKAVTNSVLMNITYLDEQLLAKIIKTFNDLMFEDHYLVAEILLDVIDVDILMNMVRSRTANGSIDEMSGILKEMFGIIELRVKTALDEVKSASSFSVVNDLKEHIQSMALQACNGNKYILRKTKAFSDDMLTHIIKQICATTYNIHLIPAAVLFEIQRQTNGEWLFFIDDNFNNIAYCAETGKNIIFSITMPTGDKKVIREIVRDLKESTSLDQQIGNYILYMYDDTTLYNNTGYTDRQNDIAKFERFRTFISDFGINT
jgi:hypothetical protein